MINKGNKKMALGLIWCLILRYQLSEGRGSSETGEAPVVFDVSNVVYESAQELGVEVNKTEKLTTTYISNHHNF
jgi:hypothetical protein